MLKRLARVAAVMLATGGITLLAPALARAEDGSSVNTSNESTVIIEGEGQGSVDVQTSSHSSSQAGTATEDSGTPPLDSQPTASDTTPNPSSTDTGSIGPSIDNTSNESGIADGSIPPSSVADGGSVNDTPATLHDKVVKALIVKANNQTQIDNNTGLPTQPDQAAPASPASRQLPPVQGALEQLNGTLAALVMPASRLLSMLAAAGSNIPDQSKPTTLIITVTAILAAASGYLDFLRRSGFHMAARGDAAGATTNTFATPQKVGSNWVMEPNYQPTFLVSETKTLNNALRKEVK